jgi:2'-5' RNA ligase
VRLFYASYLSAANMRAYQSLVDSLIEDVPGVLRSIPPKTHHLTLAFLGEVADGDLDNCLSALTAVRRMKAFAMSFGQPGILKGRGRPRLIRTSVNDGKERVSGVQATLIAHLSKSLPSIDLRLKPPHVTLARFNKSARAQQARQVDISLGNHFDRARPLEDSLSAVHLVESSLTPSGPIYKTIKEVSLAEAQAPR